MTSLRSHARACGLAMVVAAALTAASLQTLAADASGTLRVAVASFAYETFVPGDGSVAGHLYWDPIYDYMFYRNPEGKIQPGLIDSWSFSDDGLTLTMKVRQGVKWHNGRPLDAEDIAFNFKYWITPNTSKHNTTSVLSPNIESYAVTAPDEVVVKLKKPQALFLDWLSEAVSAVVVPKEYGTMDPAVVREHPIGTGAWKFASRSLGENVKFEAVPGHWRQSPSFKELEFRLIPEPSTRLAMLRRGETDIIDVPLSFKKELKDLPLNVVRAEDAFSSYLFFAGMYKDPSAPAYDSTLPWRKRAVREALNLAIDRQAISDFIFQGEARPAVVPLPLPAQPGYKGDWSPYPYDPDKAKKLLADAGYPSGFELKLISYPRPGVPDIPLMIEAVADYWSRVGVKVTIEKSEWGAIRPLVRGRQVKDFAAPITQGLASPDVIAILLGPPFYFFNISPEIEAAGAAVKGAKSGDEMADALGKLGDAMIEQQAVVPISLLNQIYVVDPESVGSWPVHAHQGGPNSFEYAGKP